MLPNMITIRFYWKILKDTLTNFSNNDIFTNSAALAYYTIFSLPPILLLIIYTATAFYDEATVKEAIYGQISELIGENSALEMANAIDQLGLYQDTIWATIVGIGVLIFTATTVFVTLQATLNKIFRVKPKPKGFGILKMARDRILSATILLGIAFILLVSLVINALIAAFTDFLARSIGELSTALTIITSIILPFLVITLLFALLFKWLPDAKIEWRDTWFGALVTSILFMIGKYFISYYIGNIASTNLYETAGSLIAVMVWFFYASLIFFFGAEFTYARIKAYGSDILPSDYAVKIMQQEYEIREQETNKNPI